jgi:hypothetical protein
MMNDEMEMKGGNGTMLNVFNPHLSAPDDKAVF